MAKMCEDKEANGLSLGTSSLLKGKLVRPSGAPSMYMLMALVRTSI